MVISSDIEKSITSVSFPQWIDGPALQGLDAGRNSMKGNAD
jgi:hypothetical protein